MKIRTVYLIAVLAFAVVITACGDDAELVLGPPQGEPTLPDLVPAPPLDMRTTVRPNGESVIRFSSTLANVGEGPFVLRATRAFDTWTVSQEITYSEGGGIRTRTEAPVVWGGDGHEHWHIQRVAVYQLWQLDSNGNVVGELDRYDAKVGFCFFDHTRVEETGPESFVYHVHDCGVDTDQDIRMGMSVGWSDVYDFGLPGQEIDIKGLEDGNYRVVATADPDGWFEESNVENNSTWVDFNLSTRDDGARLASVTGTGPEAFQNPETIPKDAKQ